MAEITKEQIEKMSPEELKELQKQQCIFCQIISGKVASRKVYEDETCLAILDINPANPGHVLLIPKEHQSIMPLMQEKDISHLFKIAKKISASQIRTLQAEGTNIFIANGAAAGQKASHFMIHLIPRKQNDGITAMTLPKNDISKEDQDKLLKTVKKKVDERFGIKEKQEPIMTDRPKPEQVKTEVDQDEKNDLKEETKPKGKFNLDYISKLFK